MCCACQQSVLGVFVVLLVAGVGVTRNCYKCYHDAQNVDLSCVSPDESTGTFECPGDDNSTSCTTIVYFDERTNEIWRLSRDCSSTSAPSCCIKEGISDYTKCTTTCDGDLCNSRPFNGTDGLPKCLLTGNDTYFWCNWCTSLEGSENVNCVEHPDSAYVSQEQCSKQTSVCIVHHQIHKATGTISSYERACRPRQPDYGLTEDNEFKTWICHCEYDYCNDNVAMGTEAECHPAAVNSAVSLTLSASVGCLLVLSFILR